MDAEIENMIRESQRNGRGRRGNPLGRTVPRPSDNELLDEYAQKLESGEAGKASLSLG